MRTLFLSLIITIVTAKCAFSNISLIGPRAGIGYMFHKTDALENGLHSAFGWSMDIPYKSGDLTGYAEAGFYFLGTEKGIFYPDSWGYFGARYKSFGIGAGPVLNPMGIGLGISPYFQIFTETLRIPVGINIEFVSSKTRIQGYVGFSFK